MAVLASLPGPFCLFIRTAIVLLVLAKHAETVNVTDSDSQVSGSDDKRLRSQFQVCETTEPELNFTGKTVLVQVPRSIGSEVVRGLCLAVRDINRKAADLLGGRRLDIISSSVPNIKGTASGTCSVGEWNYELLSYRLSGQSPFAVVGVDPRSCGGDVAVQLIAQSAKHKEFLYLNVFPALSLKYDNIETYLSVAPSQELINRAIVGLLRHYRWSHVNVLKDQTNSEDANDLLAKLQSQNVTTVTHSLSWEKTPNGVFSRLQQIGHWVIISLLSDTIAWKYLCQALEKEIVAPYYWWIVPDSFHDFILQQKRLKTVKSNCSVSDILMALEGSFSLRIHPYPDSSSQVVLPTGQNRSSVCLELGISGATTAYKEVSGFAYDAMMAVVVMLHENKTIREAKRESLAFTGATGDISVNDNGAGQVDIIYHRPLDDFSEVVGFYDGRNGSVTDRQAVRWIGGEKPEDGDGNNKLDAVLPLSSFIGCIVALSFAFFVAAFFFAFNLKYRTKRALKLSGPTLGALMTIGAALVYVSGILGGFNGRFNLNSNVSSTLCFVRDVATSSGLALLYSTVLAKTWRIRLIATRQQGEANGNRRSTTLTKIERERGAVILVVVITLLNFISSFIWLSLVPYSIQEVPYKRVGRRKSFLNLCHFDQSKLFEAVCGSFNGVLLLFGLYLAWQTRRFPIPFISNPRFTISGLVFTAIFMSLFFTASIIVFNQDHLYIIRTLCFLLSSTTVLCLEFVPKVYAVMFRGEKELQGLGAVRGTERMSMSEHCILGGGKVTILQRQNMYMKEVIILLIEERNLSDNTVRRVRGEFVDTPPLALLFEDESDGTFGTVEGSTRHATNSLLTTALATFVPIPATKSDRRTKLDMKI